MDNEIDVPSFFVCPISLEIMKDPVTVSTGITYDRESIETWLFSKKNTTCPVTKQPLLDYTDLTPNHTLRRLIQAWCTMNASHGIERIPTPKPPVNKTQISKLLKDASHSPLICLRRLKSIASGSETNKRCMEASGAVEFLASIVMNNNVDSSNLPQADPRYGSGFDLRTSASDEALGLLHNLGLSEQGLKTLLSLKNGEFIESLTRVMQKGFFESRAYAVFLLRSMAEVADPVQLLHLRQELFVELVQVLKDQISLKTSKATLQTLIQFSPWGRNRIKAVEAGTVPVLVELLLDCKERKPCEMMLVLLETLCQCAEGRAELLSHGAGLAIVSKKILRVSTLANDRAVRILFFVSKFSATPHVLQEMLKLGVVAKLCLVLQVDSGNKAKEKAREILKLHARAWKNSPCIPNNLLGSYPGYV
ncbi:E3 ubiquitin-protein ligase PUB22 [Cajanus cajan]|uniref:U-box domain-containing protein n=1 Tax=Cajanus cajan TaxID=3821 RepID=A0A151SQC0_CAJCA|nr:E3 ubiquitin-protein ligase PUB22 [Cajanus cajan]KYP56949.1 U-box domain-containing protein 22 [Cajanus cajan]